MAKSMNVSDKVQGVADETADLGMGVDDPTDAKAWHEKLWALIMDWETARRAPDTRLAAGELMNDDFIEAVTAAAQAIDAHVLGPRTADVPVDDGPVMRRGTKGDGTPWMGTMRECLEDAREAARVESSLGDEARAEVKRLRELLAAHGVKACWCAKCNPGEVRMFVCPDCGCKRCPRAESHESACTGKLVPADTPSGVTHTCSGCEENRARLRAIWSDEQKPPPH